MSTNLTSYDQKFKKETLLIETASSKKRLKHQQDSITLVLTFHPATYCL